MSSPSLVQQVWVNSCALIKVRSFCCIRGTHRVTVQRQDWTRLGELISCDKGRWVPLVQQKLLTFITAHQFTQPCSILSLNSDTMGAPSAAETSYLPIVSLFKDKIEQCWVNSCAVIKVRNFCCTWGTHRVTVQRQDWTSLSELMCSDKGKKLVHPALFNLVFE
jgi:hypothetical protein